MGALIIPGLQNDIAELCLLRAPRACWLSMRKVCRSWRDFVGSEEFCGKRKSLGLVEGWLYVQVSDEKFHVSLKAFDPTFKSWHTLPPLPWPQVSKGKRRFQSRGSSCVAANGKIYFFGGWKEGGPTAIPSTFCFDPKLNSWQQLADMQSPRCYMATAFINNCLYAIGGLTRPSQNPHDVLNTKEKYDIENDRWVSLPQSHYDTSYSRCLAYEGKLYVGDLASTSMEAYCPISNTWTILGDNKLAYALSSCSATFGGFIFCLGDILKYWDPSVGWWSALTTYTGGRVRLPTLHRVSMGFIGTRLMVVLGHSTVVAIYFQRSTQAESSDLIVHRIEFLSEPQSANLDKLVCCQVLEL